MHNIKWFYVIYRVISFSMATVNFIGLYWSWNVLSQIFPLFRLIVMTFSFLVFFAYWVYQIFKD